VPDREAIMTTATDSRAQAPTRGATRCSDCTDGLGRPRQITSGSWRDRIHQKSGLARMWRVGVFLAGLLCVALGFALAVLPGPLTIPPVLLGLWVWSTEFEWARRFFVAFRRKARDAWAHGRQHPVSSIVITVGGLAAAAVAVWAVGHFQLVERAREALGA
jgi:hypothetical protein